MRIGLLGGVRVATEDGEPVDIGSAKSQTVLAALALSPGTPLPVSRLVELVWGDAPPRTADKTLQWHVAQLRKSLGPDMIVRVGAAYRLEVAPDAVDVTRFRRCLREGDLDGALAQWGGTPLAGLDAPGLAAAVAGLTEQWLSAVEADLERRVESEPREVIGSLAELAERHPLREGLWALLMTALYRVGRQADALAAYQRARHQLVTQLGVEPGPGLRELESRILDHDERLRGPAVPEHAPPRRPNGTVTFGFAQVAGLATPRVATARLEQLIRAAADRHDGYVFAVGTESVGVAFHRADDAAAWATRLQRSAADERWHDDVEPGARMDQRAGGSGEAASGFGVELGVRIGLHTGESEEEVAAVSVESGVQVGLHTGGAEAGVGAESGVRVGLHAGGSGEPGVRVGLHTGQSEEVGAGYGGAAVQVAVGIAAAGCGGQILASGATAGLLERGDLRDLGWFHLEGDLRIVQIGEGEYPPIRLPGIRQGHLPLGVGRLFGRDGDMPVVAEALERSRVVTLVGPGGIGKTQLALAAAHAASGHRGWDAWLVELAEITSPEDVPRAVADALGVAQRPGHTLTQSIVAALRSRPALLVIDNCEHVLDGAAGLVQAVVAGCPQVRVLATARERLAVQDEQVLVVGPLDPTAGAELFHARALAADRTYDAREHHRHVEEICRRLDGIPLAIELAAARTISHRPVDLVARLDDRLRLTGGRRTGAARHRTLRAAIQWSYDLLTEAEQTLFQRLSVFTAPFDLGAAQAVADDQEVDDLLGDLVARSIVTVDFGPYGRRFRLLEPVRQFAAEHLRERGHADLAAGLHARWCLREVTHIHGLLTGPGEIEGVARLGELWANLRAAVTWACADGDPRLADALIRPIVTELPLRGRQELGGWAENLLAATSAEDQDLRAFWLVWVAERHTQNANPAGFRQVADQYGEPRRALSRYAHAYATGDGEGLLRCLPDAVAELRRQGEQDLAAFLEMTSAGTLLGIGRFEQVDTSVSALADRYRINGPPTLLHWALQTLGYSASFQGRQDEADRCFDEAARVDIPLGTLSANKATEARSVFRRGDRPRAFRLLRSHIDELIETDNVIAASVVCIEFINMMAAIDRLAEAARMLGYLEAVNDFGALAVRTLVSEAAAKVAASGRQGSEPGHHIDDRAALGYMRDVLVELTQSGTSRACS
ncbi:AfsR/SARP family transcriptional regulator [Nonomuraea sediminis]|uniref:AfsR/SARP family transcriptional regulator n=1 Tax=Nonomuraea sediminis TaxID=2835864 RepID=UPI001BDD0AEA|nr:BTAD domain-containing putative transcriptional regulator [Nonomuraea sediminis]